MNLTRNILSDRRRTLWNALEAVEADQEAFEEGEDEEQVHKGSGCDILTTIIRFRLKLTCL